MEAGTDSKPQLLPEDEDSEHDEPAASSSGWSSDDEDTDGATALGQMAQSMLAALGSPRPGTSSAPVPAAPRHRHLTGSRPAVSEIARPAAGQRLTEEEHDSSSKVAEVHWEPAVQLPSLQAADGGRREEVLRKAEPLPAGQVMT